jgi:hypothetical protein
MGLRGPDPTLLTLEVPQRKCDLREVVNGLRYFVRSGKAGAFGDIAHDLRESLP